MTLHDFSQFYMTLSDSEVTLSDLRVTHGHEESPGDSRSTQSHVESLRVMWRHSVTHGYTESLRVM